MNLSSRILVAVLAVSFSSSCGDDSAKRKAAVEQYAKVTAALYDDSQASTVQMKTSIDAFLATPSQANLDAAKAAWKTARIAYEKTEALRFYGGPIDNGEGGAPESNINPWPLDENYIDYTTDDANAGIINGTQALTKQLLRDENGSTGEANLTIGWHAIEFLLWGQDLSATGPGARPVTDYTTHASASRRKEYLRLVTEILIEDMATVQAQWKLSDANSYGAKFVAETNPNLSLSLAIKGVGNFLAGELNRERMQNGYDTKDQEEEHSCFSDTTTPIDIPESVVGAQILLTGKYKTLSGESLLSLVEAKNATLGAKFRTDLDATVAAAKAIPVPFDQALLGADSSPGRTAVLASINANKKMALTLAEVAAELGLQLDFDYCPEGVNSCRPE